MPPNLAGSVTLATLAPVPRWVAWQTEDRGDGKPPTKVPYAPDGRKARANAPRTWGTRDQAEVQHRRLPKPYQAGGVGLELGGLGNGLSLGGVDLDTCRDADGSFTPWALQVLDRLGTYAEISPSGTGAKAFFTFATEDLPTLRTAMGTDFGKQFKRGGGEHPEAIELHLGNRYFATTDQHLEDTPAELRPVALDTLLWLIQEAGPALSCKESAEPLFEQREEVPQQAAEDGSEVGPETPEQERIQSACKTHKELRRRWGGDWTGLKDQSRSGQAFALMGALKRAGFEFHDACSAIRLHRDTAQWAREKGDAAGGRELSRIWQALAEGEIKREKARAELGGFDPTEDGIALAFAKRHADVLRFDHDAGAWYAWDGTIWRKDGTKLAFSWARKLCRDMAEQGGDKDKLAKAATSGAVERFAQADRAFAVTSANWDGNDWLLGTPSGTLDLRTGELRQARQSDFITKATAVVPAEHADCPLWLAFMHEATGGDAALIRFLQQWAGYSLTGDTREHALLFGYGSGGNGKGVWLNTTAGIFGDYARNAAMDTFTASKSDKHPTDLAMLRGARLVIASETEEGRAWAEQRIKALTGGDIISARFMRQDFFEFRPRFKLTIIGNHKPILTNVDDAAKRRFNIVPFNNKPARVDRQLETKLRAEWPGILRWMLNGCLDWQRNGLVRPKIVLDATADYFSDQDTFARWIEDCCEVRPGNADTNLSLWGSWHNYARSQGEEPGGSKRFTIALQRQNFTQIRNTDGIRGRGFRGLNVKVSRYGDEGR